MANSTGANIKGKVATAAFWAAAGAVAVVLADKNKRKQILKSVDKGRARALDSFSSGQTQLNGAVKRSEKLLEETSNGITKAKKQINGKTEALKKKS
ncbi:hypothetical protein HY024_01210 [Candidatus Curtissbacteria bacterium]|nr:hypothetical protein [Candidatus Curtissbacteria bacterium]